MTTRTQLLFVFMIKARITETYAHGPTGFMSDLMHSRTTALVLTPVLRNTTPSGHTHFF